MVLDEGENIHVIERRAFESDVRRHFAGRVDRIDGTIARVTGYLFAFDPGLRTFNVRRAERSRIIPLDDARLIINIFPASIPPAELTYTWTRGDNLLLTHSSGWSLDLSEFVWASV